MYPGSWNGLPATVMDRSIPSSDRRDAIDFTGDWKKRERNTQAIASSRLHRVLSLVALSPNRLKRTTFTASFTESRAPTSIY